MDPSLANDWLLLVGTVSGFFAAAWLVAKRCRRWAKQLRHLVEQGEVWRELFGDTPARAVHAILTDVGTASDVLELRASIVARKLRIGLYVCDATTGQCIYATDYLAEIFGVPSSQLLGRGWLSQVIHASDALRAWQFSVDNRLHYSDTYEVRNGQTGTVARCRSEAWFVDSDVDRYVGYVEVIP